MEPSQVKHLRVNALRTDTHKYQARVNTIKLECVLLAGLYSLV